MLVHVTVRIEEELHACAKKKAEHQGGLSSVVRNELIAFADGRRFVEPEQYKLRPAQTLKSKRISMRLEDSIYNKALSKSDRYGGFSGLVRSILKKYIK